MIDFEYGLQLDTINRENLEVCRYWRNDSQIFRWCRQIDLISEIAQERWFEKISSDPQISMYSLFTDNGGNMLTNVGICGLTDIDLHNRRAEFSLYIAPEFQKRGFAEKGLKTLFHHGFRNLGLRSIWGETFEDNPANHLFRKLGMKEDGIRRQFYFKDGKFWDANLYSMLSSEFEESSWILTSKVS